MPGKQYRIELLVFTTYVLFAFSWVAGSLMTKDIMDFYGVRSFTAATWATNAVTIAKIAGNLMAAWVLVRLGIKKAFLLAALLITAGGLGALADHYPLYALSRLVMGFGGAFVVVYFNPITLYYFTPRQWPAINAANNASFNVGNLLALLLAPALLLLLGSWQKVILCAGLCSLVVLLLCALVLEDFPLSGKRTGAEHGAAPQPGGDYTLAQGLRDPVNWFLPFTYSGLLFYYLAVFSIFPLASSFAVETNRLAAVFITSGLAGTVCSIALTRRFRRRLPLIRVSGLLMTVTAALMLLTSSPALAYGAACLSGVFMFLSVPTILTLAQELPNMTPQRVTVIFSMFWSVSYVAVTVLMYISGRIGDYTGGMETAAAFAVACSSTYFIGSFLLPETGDAENPQ